MSDSEDLERIKIRAELASMSFEDLQKLKEELGSKVYSEAVFGTTSQNKMHKKNPVFKRENKNRPREMSSKKPVPLFDNVKQKSEREVRDPRFDSLCGTYDPVAFKKSYSFLSEVKQNELKALKKELKHAENEERVKQIKYLIQRIENQMREEKKHKVLSEKKQKEREEKFRMLKQGIKPEYIRKSDKKIMSFVEQYEDLKKSGKLEKHITKQRKKNSQKVKRNRTIMSN